MSNDQPSRSLTDSCGCDRTPDPRDDADQTTLDAAADILNRMHTCGEAGNYCDSEVHVAVSELRYRAGEIRSWPYYCQHTFRDEVTNDG